MALTGMLDIATLTPVQGGLRLLASAAESWLWVAAEVQRRYGWTPTLTDAYRDYAAQVALFTERYTTAPVTYAPGLTDRRWWDGKWWYRKPYQASAAVPGTSNHGRGDTVDVKGLGAFDSPAYAQFAAVATEAGWDNTEGRAVDEPWHWQHSPDRDHHADAPTPVTKPTALEEADDMLTTVKILYAEVLGRTGTIEEWAGWLKDGETESELIDRFLSVKPERGTVIKAFADFLHRTNVDDAGMKFWLGKPSIKAVRDGVKYEASKG